MPSPIELPVATIADFFEKCPPGTEVRIEVLGEQKFAQYSSYWSIPMPFVQLHCSSVACAGLRFFSPLGEETLDPGKTACHFTAYVCRNCGETQKNYAYTATLDDEGNGGVLHKYGEHPAFGPPVPSRVVSLVGPDKEYFLKGRRAENQGMGIAAFAYYRRVIESQRLRIFDELIRVATKLGADQDLVADLNNAKHETQFSKAVDQVKHALPPVLFINGHNPLALLHSALSEGLHAQTDEVCLELATSIRIVLYELVDRIALAMKEEAALAAAVSRLLKPKAAGKQ
jgi:hypothetical protein